MPEKKPSEKWIVQDHGANRPGYPNWHTYTVRDAVTNVCIGTIGNVDRYYENEAKGHADLAGAAPAMKAALHAALFFVPMGTNARKMADEAIDAAEGRAAK